MPACRGADREKLEELSLIYGSYEAQLAQTAMDPGDRQQLARRCWMLAFLRAAPCTWMSLIPSRAQTRPAGCHAAGADVTVCLCCDGEQDTAGGMGLFSGVQRVIAA